MDLASLFGKDMTKAFFRAIDISNESWEIIIKKGGKMIALSD